jgi:hypothetical protein
MFGEQQEFFGARIVVTAESDIAMIVRSSIDIDTHGHADAVIPRSPDFDDDADDVGRQAEYAERHESCQPDDR